MSAKIIDGRAVARKVRAACAERVRVLAAQGVIAHATVRPPLAQLGEYDKADLLTSVRVAGILPPNA